MHIFCDRNSFSVDSCCQPSIRISEVHPRGHYIRIINASQCQAADLGNHFLLQRYQDTPFTVFRFPSSVCLQPLGVATVWSASGAAEECCAGRQLPTTDFIFSSQPIWASGPDCITILCKPNEQALKWLSASPSLSKRSQPSTEKKKKQQQQRETSKNSVVCQPPYKDDPCKQCQQQQPKPSSSPSPSRGKKSEEGGDRGGGGSGKRQQQQVVVQSSVVDCDHQPQSDSSPERRLVQRKRGVTCGEKKEKEEECDDLERRRKKKAGEARKRKKKEEDVKVEERRAEEEECLGCEEEIRRRRRRRRKQVEEEERRKRKTSEEDDDDGCWKISPMMDKKIPCTFVHIEDQVMTSPTAQPKVNAGGGRGGGGGGGGGCVTEDSSECGDERADCGEASQPNCCRTSSLINDCKNVNDSMSDCNHDDTDCCGGGGGGGRGGGASESPKQKRFGHGSFGRCLESRDGSLKGGNASRLNDCKEKKASRNGGRGGRQGGSKARGCCGGEGMGKVMGRGRGGGCGCGSEDDEDEDECEDDRKRKVIPALQRRRNNCEDCDFGKGRMKDEEDESVQEKWNRPTTTTTCGGGGCGGGRRGGGGEEGGACGGSKRRTKDWKDGCEEECCGSGKEGNWTRWTKWLSGLVSGPLRGSCNSGGGGGGGGGGCDDQPCFSSSPANVSCSDRMNVADTEVRCIDQVRVRELCPTYQPRLAKRPGCGCSDGCPVCPPKKAECSEEVAIVERSRTKEKPQQQQSEKKKCECKEEKKGGGGGCGGASASRSDGCLASASAAVGVCECLCHLDSVALTAASVMAAGLTVAAVYCH